MIRQAKAPSAASTSAKRFGPKLSFALLCTLAFCLIPASQAFAKIIVDLNGAGAGTVTSTPPGIECSNVPGEEKEAESDCTHVFGFFEFVELTATPSSTSLFTGWTGSIGVVELGGTCDVSTENGMQNPCFLFDLEGFGDPYDPITVEAGFECQAPVAPPQASTGDNGPGANPYLVALEGTVDPEGCGLEECRFEYGQTTKYGFEASCVPGIAGIGKGSSEVPVIGEAELEELAPNTTYHYRLNASGPGGKSKGEDRTFTTGPPPSEAELPPSDQECENKEIRERQVFGALLLPDCMALEMVSPPQKGGQPAYGPDVSADGGRVRFFSIAALGGTTGGLSLSGDAYIATQGPSGWTTAATNPPPGILEGWRSLGGAAGPNSFTPDFSRWFRIGATKQQTELGTSRAFQESLGGFYQPLSPPMTSLVEPDEFDVRQTQFQGASADHSHLFFVPGLQGGPSAVYLSGDPEADSEVGDYNTYIAHLDGEGQPALELLARDSSNRVWGGSCGARLGGVRPGFVPEHTGDRNQGAISPDGKRVYFSTRPTQPEAAPGCDKATNKLRILERLEGKLGIHIGELFASECTRPDCSSADGDDYYQGASLDGSKVYFTTSRQLADPDLDEGTACSVKLGQSEGCDLYLYDSSRPPGHRLIQVSAGGAGDPTPGEGAGVLNGVVAISGDGSHVYFAAQGILTSDTSPKGSSPAAGEPNLYAWDAESEEVAFIGSLDPGDTQLWGDDSSPRGLHPVPELGTDSEGNEIGGDGHILPFRSRAALTADDGDGERGDVFRYDAASDELVRISKAQGTGDDGAFDAGGGNNPVTLGTDTAEIERRVSEDGETVLFSTAQGLIPGDVNGADDLYLWQGGTLYRLPGVDPGGSRLSHEGSTIAFATRAALLPQDGDTTQDVYVAQAGGGYPQASEAPPCQADGALPGRQCIPSAPAPPPAPSSGSAALVGSGNPPKKPRRCGKGRVRRHGRCDKKPRKGKAGKRANRDRRSAK